MVAALYDQRRAKNRSFIKMEPKSPAHKSAERRNPLLLKAVMPFAHVADVQNSRAKAVQDSKFGARFVQSFCTFVQSFCTGCARGMQSHASSAAAALALVLTFQLSTREGPRLDAPRCPSRTLQRLAVLRCQEVCCTGSTSRLLGPTLRTSALGPRSPPRICSWRGT